MYQRKLSNSELSNLLKLTTSESSLIFESLYKQIDGVATSPLLGLNLANICLCHYQELWLENCPPEFKPVAYKRYIANIFVLFTPKDHLLSLATYMSTRHKDLSIFSKIIVFSKMLRLLVEVKDYPLLFLVKPLLLEFSLTLIGLFSSLKFTLLFRCFPICSDRQNFHLRCVKTFLNKVFLPNRTFITLCDYANATSRLCQNIMPT